MKLKLTILNNEKAINKKETLKILTDEAIAPKFFYNHYPTEEDYRAAIIGGDIFYNKNSDLNLKIASVDIATNEIFLYDLSSGDLMINPPQSDAPKHTITSIRTLNNDNFDLVYTTFDGKLIFIKLNYSE